MGLLKLRGGEITPQRRTTDFGETTWADLEPIEHAAFDLESPTVDTSVSGNRYMQTGFLFVPRGSDLKDGDRVSYQGKMFGVVGDAQFDMDHPITGADFGVVYYSVRLGG